MFKRKTSISEFEREKPLLTYKLIQGAIYKYERLRDDRQTDAAFFEVYAKVVEDLKSIQKSFVAGE